MFTESKINIITFITTTSSIQPPFIYNACKLETTLHYVLSDVRGQVFGTDPYVNH